MNTVARWSLVALGVVVGASVPVEDAVAGRVKFRTSSSSTSAPIAPAVAPAAAATAATAATTPEQGERISTFAQRAERALEEERLGDTNAMPMPVKPTGGGATFVPGPTSTERMQCIAGC